jgi:glycosyltransferase involved in cell wall biosynthesis
MVVPVVLALPLGDTLDALLGGMCVRICHVCSGHSADDGRVFHRACTTLAAAGYEVHLVAVGKGTQPYHDRGVTIHPLPECSSSRKRLARRSRVARIAADLKPDLFHVHEPELLGPTLGCAGSRPVIYDVHESYLDVILDREWIPQGLRHLARFAWEERECHLVRRCAGVIAVTERIAERYRRMHRSVHVVANYPDLVGLEALPFIDRDRESCVFAGTLDPNRGLAQAFTALAILKGRGLSVPLRLAGRGSEQYLHDLMRKADQLDISELVTYHGVLPQSQAAALAQGSGIGLVPHLPIGNNLAAVPVKMLEYMALGLPLVYSDLSNHRRLVGACGAGFAVDPTRPEQIADAVERLVRNPNLAWQMGEAGRCEIRERLNWGLERVKMIDLYEAILGPLDRCALAQGRRNTACVSG